MYEFSDDSVVILVFSSHWRVGGDDVKWTHTFPTINNHNYKLFTLIVNGTFLLYVLLTSCRLGVFYATEFKLHLFRWVQGKINNLKTS